MKKRVNNIESRFAEIVPLNGLNSNLVYEIPNFLINKIKIGQLVRIPIRSKIFLGIVKKINPILSNNRFEIKSILEILYDKPIINDELSKLINWCAEYYACSFDSILQVAVPKFLRNGVSPKKELIIKLRENIKQDDIANINNKAHAQIKILKFLLSNNKPHKKNDFLKKDKFSSSALKSLIDKGFIIEKSYVVSRDAYLDNHYDDNERISQEVPELNKSQNEIISALIKPLESNQFSVEVVHGVTGSGKTEIYLNAISRVLNKGGSAIFLVPEISLAPQTVSRVRERLKVLGVKVAVWHSHLSHGERFDSWNSIIKGEAKVVVGARSAIFAPLKDLKLIIVDEEHDPSYKQGENPRYNGRDVAVYRSYLNNATCILGSATPSLETLRNTEIGKYNIHKMMKRVDDRELPKIHIVDMRREYHKGINSGPLSDLLSNKLSERFHNKEQSILFLNRRGYASNFLCNKCGHVMMCKHCSIPMTIHKTDWSIRCHLCGISKKLPKSCPDCGDNDVLAKGYGTQRIEDIVSKFLPKAKVVRIDADVMQKKNLYRKIFNDFRVGKIDVLIGTQMIAKGLDFPNVTLVGLVDADRSLHIEDFRANERTFQLIVQVSGRAGRGDRSGEVVVQTCTPAASPILYARQSDFEGFISEELNHRKEFNYPPYTHLIRHVFMGRNPDKILFYINTWKKQISKNSIKNFNFRGPVPAPIEKIKDEYRFQMWYIVPNVANAINYLSDERKKFKKSLKNEIKEWLDVDPIQLS